MAAGVDPGDCVNPLSYVITQRGQPVTDSIRVWLVERDYDDEGLVRLVYATPEGDRRLVSERSTTMLARSGVTAAVEKLQAVSSAETRERYRTEVERVRGRHAPDDSI